MQISNLGVTQTYTTYEKHEEDMALEDVLTRDSISAPKAFEAYLTRGWMKFQKMKEKNWGSIKLASEENRMNRDFLVDFLGLEEQIKDDEKFWRFMGTLYSACNQTGHFKDDIINACNRYGRMNIHTRKRYMWALSNDKFKNSPELVKFYDKLQGVKHNDEITVYRGFLINKDSDQIRKGKLGSDEYNMQNDGIHKGLSYTLDKNVAQLFATHYLPLNEFFRFHYEVTTPSGWNLKEKLTEIYETKRKNNDDWCKKYLQLMSNTLNVDSVKDVIREVLTVVEWDELIRTMEAEVYVRQGMVRTSHTDNLVYNLHDDLVRGVIGTYRVNKKDIMFPCNLGVWVEGGVKRFKYEGEQEVVIDPSKVTLERYEFLSSESLLTDENRTIADSLLENIHVNRRRIFEKFKLKEDPTDAYTYLQFMGD